MTDIRAPAAFWSVPEAELLHGLATSAQGLARIEAIRRASLQAGISSRRKSSAFHQRLRECWPLL
jgi:hypothetical protein